MLREIASSPINLLLVAAPISWALAVMSPESPWVFMTAAASLIPLAGLIGLGTEHLAHRAGPAWGGFLNATFGNAAELVLAKRRLGAAVLVVEPIVGVELVIPQELKTAAVIVVGAGPDLNVHHAARGTAEFGRIGAGLNFELVLLLFQSAYRLVAFFDKFSFFLETNLSGRLQ